MTRPPARGEAEKAGTFQELEYEMTTNEIVERARLILSDTVAPYRWPDVELVQDVQMALDRLANLRPSVRYAGGILRDRVELPSARGSAIDGVDERFLEPLALYVAYLAYHNDATDTANAERAASCLARAEGMMA